MYQSKKPSPEDLPSSKKLIQSTLIAFLVALALLITVVMPAEYGIDPTGIGKTLGLKEMGDIKVSLQEESDSEKKKPKVEEVAEVSSVVQPKVDSTEEKNSDESKTLTQPVTNEDLRSVTLAPGKAVEIKLIMKKGAKVEFEWETKGGVLNYDLHGDSKTVEFFSYKKGRALSKDEGVFVAEFDGSHGWFWRNRDKQDVVLTLSVKGSFSGVKQY